MPLFAALDRLKADLDALRPLAPDAEQRLMQELRLEWSYHTSALEGNALTLGEARALLLHGLTAADKPLRDHLALATHHAAMRWLEDFVRDEGPLTEQLIRSMHKVLLGQPTGGPALTGGPVTLPSGRPGQYKISSNNVLKDSGEVVYFSRPEDTPARMADLVAWHRQETAHPTLHPVARAARLYHRFVRIHPFADGNSRLARLLLNLVLLRHGYGITIIKATDRARYEAALAAADAGQPEPFLHFIIEHVETSLRRQLRAARGESIDEPTDLETKLARLKQQLLRRPDAVEALWTEEMQAKVYDVLLGFWLHDLQAQTQGFDDLFMTQGYGGGLTTALPAPVVLEETGELDAFAAVFRAAIAGAHARLESATFFKKWYHFRQRDNGFDVSLRVTFHFQLDHFTVVQALVSNYGAASPETSWQGEVYTATYLPAYASQRFEECNGYLATRLYDFIASKMATADAPLVK